LKRKGDDWKMLKQVVYYRHERQEGRNYYCHPMLVFNDGRVEPKWDKKMTMHALLQPC
jgi:hypothetical protein